MSTIRVDRIMPFQSSSVEILGSFNGTYTGSFTGSFVGDGSGLTGIPGTTPIDTSSFATTGSNTFIGNQNIQGTITASIQEGYVLVGGSGNVSILAATSSFGGGGSTDITALNSFTSSQENLNVTFATTGSNTFIGNQVISGSLTISGSSTFINIGPTILSGSVSISGSINSDGYQLEASSTETIPTLNDSFNLDLVPSGSTTTFINKSLVLGDGKVLIAGRFQSIDGHTTNDIARLNSDGTIDTSFTAPMFSGSNFVGGDTAGWINTFATQSDGKIVVGGNFIRVGEGGDARRGIARLNTDGTLDETFVIQSFDSFASSNGVRDLVIQDDGKIIFVGAFTSGSRRVNTDGTLDTTFDISQGNNQPLAFNNGDFYSVALIYGSGSEQDVLIGGRFSQWGSYGDYNHLVKLFPNGRLDFGFAGANLDILWSSDGYNAGDRIETIKVGSDNNIYIAGRFKDTGIGNHAGFARVLPTDDRGDGRGALDNGFRTYISGSYVNDFDFYDGDKILLGGDFATFGNPASFTTSANRFVIIDQNDGGLVSNWISDELASKYVFSAETSVNRSVNSVTLLPNDNVLVGGPFTFVNGDYRANGGLASLKLTGFGEVTTTIDYSITADTNELLISSSNTRFSGDVNILGNVNASVISGSFVGDGSGLTSITLPSGVVSGSTQVLGGSGILSSSVTNFTEFSQSVDARIDNISVGTGFATTSSFNELTQSFNSFTSSQDDLNVTFATTGSNTFIGNQVISGSVRISGSISQRGIGNGNIVIGDDPITNLNSDAQNNTVIGADAGALLRSGSNNVFIGKMAGLLNQDANSNVFIGSTAGYNNKSTQNVYIGESAGFSNISGRFNVAIGHQAGYNNKVDLNVFIGWQSGFQNTSGSANTFVGERSGEQNTTGQSNSFFGATAGMNNSVGNYNTFIGLNAGQQNTSASFNTFVGSQAGYSTTTGGNNTFIGAESGFMNTTGYQNVFLGDNVGINVTTAYENTFIGSFSGRENRDGVRNTFVGLSAGMNNGVGNDNTFVGHRAGDSNISGSNNTLVGKSAGSDNTIGNRNTLLGTEASTYATSGDDNLMLGYRAGAQQISGANLTNSNTSVFLGSNARGVNNASNQIVIGALAEGAGSNTTVIGNSNTTATYLKGTLNVSTAILSQVSSSYDFADDTAAQAGGVPLGGLYHTSGVVKIRLV